MTLCNITLPKLKKTKTAFWKDWFCSFKWKILRWAIFSPVPHAATSYCWPGACQVALKMGSRVSYLSHKNKKSRGKYNCYKRRHPVRQWCLRLQRIASSSYIKFNIFDYGIKQCCYFLYPCIQYTVCPNYCNRKNKFDPLHNAVFKLN